MAETPVANGLLSGVIAKSLGAIGLASAGVTAAGLLSGSRELGNLAERVGLPTALFFLVASVAVVAGKWAAHVFSQFLQAHLRTVSAVETSNTRMADAVEKLSAEQAALRADFQDHARTEMAIFERSLGRIELAIERQTKEIVGTPPDGRKIS